MLDLVRPVPLRRLAFGAVFVCLAPAAAFAEPSSERAPNWLEQRVDGLERSLSFFGREEKPAAPSNVQMAQSSSLADIAVRLDRLENQMRQLNGRLDEIQYQGRKNDEALKRFQGDVDFRFQDIESGKSGGGSSGGGSRPPKRGDAGDAMGGPTAGLGGRDGGLGAPPASLGQSRGGDDAIGGLIGGADDGDPNAPMSIRPPGVGGGRAPTIGGDRMAARDDSLPGVTAGAGGARDQFDLGVGFIQRRDYNQAEATFRDFLRTYPKDAKAPEARYWLGESQYQRKNYTDAVATFLEIYKDAPGSAKAPESMLKLGMALNGMGQKEQACATLDAAGKKYARIKAQSDREFKRLSC
ncbi:tol-pal system protein YbgF [Chelatococcus sambhunathii]|uniref:Cell division coordinator CpoB n=1 Tax=Chelatococcus sambhunathii TaxID=363953 RepID=A0ABU1DJ55_9HYPH|nr:tol-pal system protein YbgF [Chelatococcus sambhunathii]MDR4308124.1 tol-pal system protein YbgF [Chelatococcus sambhunathii]